MYQQATWKCQGLSCCPANSSIQLVCRCDLQSASPGCPGTAKAGGGDFVCGKCDGTSTDGRRQYSSKPGATACSLCPVDSRVNAAHTACISYPPGTQPGPGNARRPCPAGELPQHIEFHDMTQSTYSGVASLPVMCICMIEWAARLESTCVVPACNSLLSSSAKVTCYLHCLLCPGTAKAGNGDFACGKCGGTSADGRQRYSSKAGATSCRLCPVGGRVNGARTTCSKFCPVFAVAEHSGKFVMCGLCCSMRDVLGLMVHVQSLRPTTHACS